MTTSRAEAGRLGRAASAVAIAVALVTGLAACGGSGHPSTEVSTRTLPRFGTVLVNGKGLTLNMFVPAADSAAGQTNGQDLDNNGGPWFVMRPSGQIVRTPR